MVGFVQDFEQEEERDGAGGSDSDMDDNVGWSTVNLDEEQKQPDVSPPYMRPVLCLKISSSLSLSGTFPITETINVLVFDHSI